MSNFRIDVNFKNNAISFSNVITFAEILLLYMNLKFPVDFGARIQADVYFSLKLSIIIRFEHESEMVCRYVDIDNRNLRRFYRNSKQSPSLTGQQYVLINVDIRH